MNDFSNKINEAAALLADAEAIVVGAGAGLSTAAGYQYDGKRFHANFHDFEAKYGFHDMYSGSFFPFETTEERWAFLSRLVRLNRYTDPPKRTYANLLSLLQDKDYFVITTNVDHCFQRAGFDKQRLFYTQGDYGLLQCGKPCHHSTYDNAELIEQMCSQEKNMRIPSELVPRCPKCGRIMTLNLRSDDTFVEDVGWHNACNRYENFVRTHKNGKVVYLEIGVGFNTPVIIKYPFWRLTACNPLASYVCINYNEAVAPESIQTRSVCIQGDADDVVCRLLDLKL